MRTLKGNSGCVCCVQFNPTNPGQLFSGSGDDTVRLWDIGSGKPLKQFLGHRDWVRCVQFSPTDAGQLSGSDDKTVRLWDPQGS